MPVEPIRLGPDAVDDRPDPGSVWRALTATAHVMTDAERACLLAAQAQIDTVWTVAAQGLLDPEALRAGVRDEGWYRLAVTAYHLLSTSGAYAHLAGFQPVVCSASTDLDVWLARPADPPGAGTVADALIGGPQGRYDHASPAQCLADLVAAAQATGLFGVPDHHITVVADMGANVGGNAARVRILLDALHGPALASGLLRIGDLVDPHLYGVNAATAALRNTSRVVDAVVRFPTGAAQAGRPSPPSHVRAWAATGEDRDVSATLPHPTARHPLDVAETVTPYRISGGRAFAPLGERRAIPPTSHPDAIPRADPGRTAAR